MTRFKAFSILFVAMFFLFTGEAKASISPVSIAIIPPVQFPPNSFSIVGVRASALWGRHRDIYGFDFSAVGNITEQDFVGVGASGVFNWTQGQTTILGLQLAGVLNLNTDKTKVYGLQVALGANSNTAASKVVGLQVSMANLGKHTNIYGFQVGLYNRALNVYGIQVGIVNYATSLHGIQIGLINFHHKGTVSVSPIINIGF